MQYGLIIKSKVLLYIQISGYISVKYHLVQGLKNVKFLPIDLLDQIRGVFNFFPGQTATCELREKVINLDDFTSTLTLQIVDFTEIDVDFEGNVFINEGLVYIGSTGNVFIGSAE